MVKKIVVTTDSWVLTQETQMVTRYELKKYGNQKVTKKKDMTSKVKFQRGFYGIQSTQFRT